MRFVIALVALVVVGVPAAPARYERAGVTVAVPDGWTPVLKPLSSCTNPAQRLALRGRGALVQIVERLGPTDLSGFPERPARFELRDPPRWIGCCVPAEREDRGWFLSFRDGNRGFHAYVYLGGPGTRAEALRILDSLRVRARPVSA